MNKKTNINILQIGMDGICLAFSYVVAVFTAGNIFGPVDWKEFIWIPTLFGLAYIFMMLSCEMYNRSTFTYQDRTIRYIIKSCFLAAVVCLVMIPVTFNGRSALNILMIYILSTVVIISIQSIIMQELRHVSGSRWKKHAIFIGCMDNIQEYLYYIKKTSFQVEAVGYVTLDSSKPGEKNLGEIKNLESILKNMVIDEVIFAVPSGRLEEIKPYFFMCKSRGLTVRIALDFFDDMDVVSSVHAVGTIPVFTYQMSGLNDVQSVVKRLIDIVVSFFGLCFTLLVSLIAIPILKIRMEGSVFVPSKYFSINGRTLTLYSFRTTGSDGAESALGRFLRRTSMNNLPMFWSVLKGDMSLVGSRPIPVKNLVLRKEIKNITVKPGLTGAWRFAGSKKNKDEDYLAGLDSSYLHKWSLARDLWLLFKTAIFLWNTKSSRIQTKILDSMEDNQSSEVSYSLLR